ncbi:MAG: DNA-binding protein [Cupriavidus sp.]|nr:DNA-binding protein [Cupriavidus sp.]QWE94824.1 DNA-binding protein [Cupriavidus sp. EM10]MCA3190294.1 DNA-binding protein [Cupriavidus sp.]MCA3196998.1 DNA-binding protein [Cupriavidus sp.]MCA3202275.1 DNA-binding protein [Cupriavidus sp.]
MGVKYRPLRPRSKPRAGRAIVRTHRPWRAWLLVGVLASVVGAVAGVSGFEVGRHSAAPHGVGADLASAHEELGRRLAEVSAERDSLRQSANTAEAQLQMARTAQAHMAEQVKAAEAEVAQLKEDLGFFESLLPATADTSGIHVRSFRVALDEAQPRALHYRLLVMQGGSKAFVAQPEFRGEVQFTISGNRHGKPLTLVLPQSGDAPLPAVRLTHYQRIEGDLAIPQDAEVRAVSVRIVQNGQVRTTQTATP